MEREGFGRCAAQDSADNSRVRYMKGEQRGPHLTMAMRCLLLFVWRRQGGEGGWARNEVVRVFRDQPSIEELCNAEV